ncbi:hypothetical protein SAMN05216389_12156 [Oceanobacillus limi]|uniref:Uncharacterized protein n=1 Tax=Oceanobacillus limi TaxID=930131 RepID=A0A1I0GGQ4_9BACI|nr:hypothetical protein [Oceanobacillus limi]SET70054.1 hypothetical protein SAMN05216389_12156 [Oceanobacillus limi]
MSEDQTDKELAEAWRKKVNSEDVQGILPMPSASELFVKWKKYSEA